MKLKFLLLCFFAFLPLSMIFAVNAINAADMLQPDNPTTKTTARSKHKHKNAAMVVKVSEPTAAKEESQTAKPVPARSNNFVWILVIVEVIFFLLYYFFKIRPVMPKRFVIFKWGRRFVFKPVSCTVKANGQCDWRLACPCCSERNLMPYDCEEHLESDHHNLATREFFSFRLRIFGAKKLQYK